MLKIIESLTKNKLEQKNTIFQELVKTIEIKIFFLREAIVYLLLNENFSDEAKLEILKNILKNLNEAGDKMAKFIEKLEKGEVGN